MQEIWLQVNGAYGLEKKEIADAIGISDDQKEKLAQIQRINSEDRRDARKELTGSTAQKRNAKMAELHRQAEKRILQILTVEQRKQFEKMQGKKITIDLF